MSRTYKKFPTEGYFRCPRGRRNALRSGIKGRKLPPDSWDDINHDPHCWQPYKVARNMAKQGWPREKVVEKLMGKWRLSRYEAMEATFLHEYDYPESGFCAVVYRERISWTHCVMASTSPFGGDSYGSNPCGSTIPKGGVL